MRTCNLLNFMLTQSGGMELIMIQITTSELKSNIARYIALVEKEDILITRNGKTVAKLVSQTPNKVEMAKSLFGILKGVDIDENALKDERRSKI